MFETVENTSDPRCPFTFELLQHCQMSDKKNSSGSRSDSIAAVSLAVTLIVFDAFIKTYFELLFYLSETDSNQLSIFLLLNAINACDQFKSLTFTEQLIAKNRSAT